MTIDLNEVVAEQLAPKNDMTPEDWEKYLSVPTPTEVQEEDSDTVE